MPCELFETLPCVSRLRTRASPSFILRTWSYSEFWSLPVDVLGSEIVSDGADEGVPLREEGNGCRRSEREASNSRQGLRTPHEIAAPG